MGTAGGEPRLLLNALKPMLGLNGDIKTQQEVVRIVGMMKDAEKLVSRCIYLSILHATCDVAEKSPEKRDALLRFLSGGGWGILNKWMNEFLKTENYSMLSELLDVLRLLPVSVDLLKQGNTGKVVKQLTKVNDAALKRVAGVLIRQWKDMIRGDTSADRPPNGERKVDSPDNASSPSSVKRQSSLDGKEPPDKKARMSNSLKPAPKVKLIDPLPKAAMESGGFMDALMNAAVPTAAAKKKRKMIPLKGSLSRGGALKTHLPLDEILNQQGGDAGSSTPPRESGDAAMASAENSPLSQGEATGSPTNTNDNGADSSVANKEVAKRTKEEVPSSSQVSGKKSKKSKCLRWAPDENLVEVSYFELNEEELAHMHHSSFSAAKHNELLQEREAFSKSAKKFNEDTMKETVQWCHPVLVDAPPLPFELGTKSKEKTVQLEREKKVLADIFLTKASLPDSPAEADVEADSGMRAEPVLIPHDEDGTVYPMNGGSSQSTKPTVQRAPVKDPQPTTPVAGNVTDTVRTILDKLRVNSGDKSVPAADLKRGGYSNAAGAPPEQDKRYQLNQQGQAGPGFEMPVKGAEGNETEGPPRDGPFNAPHHLSGGFGGPPHLPDYHRGGPPPPMHLMPPRGPPPVGQPVPLLSMKLPSRGGGGGPFRGGPRGMGPHGPPPDHMGGPRYQGRDFDDGNMDGDYDMGDEEGIPPHMQGPPGPWIRPPPFRARGRGMMRGHGRGRGVCRHFLSHHGCRMGMDCHFLHPGINGPPLM